jgi:CDP-paratose 2-epimerase
MGKVDQGVIVLWMAKHFWKSNLKYIGYGGLGQQARDILHVRDLFNLVNWQLNNLSHLKSQIYNVGGGLNNTISLAELTDLCSKITGNNIQIDSIQENRPGDLPVYITDNSKITKFTEWYPKIGIEQLLIEIHQWLIKDEKQLKNILS